MVAAVGAQPRGGQPNRVIQVCGSISNDLQPWKSEHEDFILWLHPKHSIETQQKLTMYTHISANTFLMLVLHKRSDVSNRRAIKQIIKEKKKERKKRGSKESYPRFKGTVSQCDWADNLPHFCTQLCEHRYFLELACLLFIYQRSEYRPRKHATASS